MFESKGKQELNNKLKGVSKSSINSNNKFGFQPEKTSGPTSVYGELKLSDHLASSLNAVRDEVDELKEQLEASVYKNGQFEKQIVVLQKQIFN